MARRKARKWYCKGCDKHHSMDRFIEGETAPGEYWCAHSMKKAVKEGRNYRPPEHQYRSL